MTPGAGAEARRGAETRSLADLVVPSTRRLTAHELVRTTLRRAVLSGALPGGMRLVQAEIATQLDVSTTPVREALRDLATEGLIKLDAHRGAIVRSIDRAEIAEIYELRALLEPLAVRRWLSVLDDEQFARAERLLDAADATEDPREWAELNRRFHEALMAPERSPRLHGILTSLQDSAAMYVCLALHAVPQLRTSGAREHRALLEAYRARDQRAAIDCTLAHLETAAAALGSEDVDPGAGT